MQVLNRFGRQVNLDVIQSRLYIGTLNETDIVSVCEPSSELTRTHDSA